MATRCAKDVVPVRTVQRVTRGKVLNPWDVAELKAYVGKYEMAPGKTVVVEKLTGDAGAPVVFDQVLLVSSGDGGEVTIGKPTVAGAKVTGEIVEQGRGEKLVVFKFRRRKNYVRRTGHRQNYTAVKIAEIQA